MSGDCAQMSTHHSDVLERVKKRIRNLQHRSHESQIHLNASLPLVHEAERDKTQKLLMKAQEGTRQKQMGKHKSDPLRTKHDEALFVMRDSNEMGLPVVNLKRKMEMSNSIHRPHGVFNGVDSISPSDGIFNGSNGIEYPKKIKLDPDPKVLSANGSGFGQAGSANNNNCNSGNLTHQQANSFVSNTVAVTRMDTRRDVQVSNPNTFESNHVIAQSPLTPFSQTEPSPAQNAVVDPNLDELDLESLFNDIDDGKFNGESQNEAQPIAQLKNVERPQHNNQALPTSVINNTNNSSQLQYYKNNASQQPQKIAPSPSAVQQMSPYNNPPSNQMKTVAGGQNQQQNNLTSPHLQNLTATFDSNFGSPVDQQTLTQPMPVNRIQTPSSVDKVSHTPEGIQPVRGAMTPSPNSYSLPFSSQNSSNNVKAPGAGGNSLYSPISPRGQAFNSTAVAPVLSRSVSGQQSFMQNPMPQTNQGGFVNQSRGSITPGLTMSRGGMPVSPKDMNAPIGGNVSQQQMKLFHDRRMMPNMVEQQQRSAFTSGMAMRNPELSQQHVTVNMQNISGQQSTVPNRSLTGQSNLSAMHQGNINAANAAAQQALAASQIQHNTAYPSRLPQYPMHRSSPGFSQQQALPSKAMPHNCGDPNCSHNYSTSLTMRGVQPSLPGNGLTRSMSGNYTANFNPSNHPGSYNRVESGSNTAIHQTSMQMNSFTQQQRELEKYKMKLAAQQRFQQQQQQREMTQTLSHPPGHIMNQSRHPGGISTSQKAATIMNRQMSTSTNGASWNELNYGSSQGGVDQHQNIPYSSYPSRSYSFSPARNFSSMPNEFLQHSVSVDRGSTLQRSNPVQDRLNAGQMLQNNPMPQPHMRSVYGSSHGQTSDSMLQGHLVQKQLPHGFRSQSIPTNAGINRAAY